MKTTFTFGPSGYDVEINDGIDPELAAARERVAKLEAELRSTHEMFHEDKKRIAIRQQGYQNEIANKTDDLQRVRTTLDEAKQELTAAYGKIGRLEKINAELRDGLKACIRKDLAKKSGRPPKKRGPGRPPKVKAKTAKPKTKRAKTKTAKPKTKRGTKK